MHLRNNNSTRILLLVVFALALYAVLPQLTGFQDSLTAVKSSDKLWLVLSIVAISASYLFAGLTYYLLASKKLRYFTTVVLEIAATFINRLLPAGIGGMGVNYVYLRHNRHSQGAAASVVAINNVLGFLGHAILFSLIYLIFMPTLPEGTHIRSIQTLAVITAVVIVCTWVMLSTSLGRRFQRQIKQVRTQLKFYKKNPANLGLALISSMALTLCVSIAFYSCILAFHLDVSYAVAFLIFSAGFAVGNASPTPGGLGGVEAGLVFGLIAYDIPRVDAIATVLTFRLISFWLPTAVGALAFVYAQQKKIL